MDFHEFPGNYDELVATAADVCMKPWKHAVVRQNLNISECSNFEDSTELVLRIECRNNHGDRHPENDLDLEIYRSGIDFNLMLGWCNQLDRPILWQGQHSVWMDGNTGKRSHCPVDGHYLEAFARRLRALFGLSVVN